MDVISHWYGWTLLAVEGGAIGTGGKDFHCPCVVLEQSSECFEDCQVLT